MLKMCFGVREQVDVLEREGWVLKMCFGVREQVDVLERGVGVEDVLWCT